MSSDEPIIDHDLLDEDDLPYSSHGVLGFGHSGTVERVKDLKTGLMYARKTIRITGTNYERKERRRVFQNEVDIIRELERHSHIIRVHATYCTERNFGLVLEPVASDNDLEDFIREYYKALRTRSTLRVAAMATVIERAFGCLAAGLAFMHGKRIRHKDIKPRNILVHAGKMIYTDFGYSFDSNGFTRSATGGLSEHFTRRYSCPEVLNNKERNSNSDVFSLGCVFMDMVWALTDQKVPVPERECFANIIEHLHQQVLSTRMVGSLEALPKIIVRMTTRNSADRLCSTHTAAELLRLPQHRCDECASSPIEDWAARAKEDDCCTSAAPNFAMVSETRDPVPQITRSDTIVPSTLQDSISQLSRRDTIVHSMGPPAIVQVTPAAPDEVRQTAGKEETTVSAANLTTVTSQGIMNGWSNDRLDRLYYIREGPEATEFFLPGRVFSKLHPDFDTPQNATGTAVSESAVYAKKKAETRHFVVVQTNKRKQLIHAGEIYTPKPGYDASGYAIVHIAQTEPHDLASEHGMTKHPIAIRPLDPTFRLEPTSRLNFRAPNIFQWSIRIRDEGRVIEDHIVRLIGYHRQEQTGHFERDEE